MEELRAALEYAGLAVVGVFGD